MNAHVGHISMCFSIKPQVANHVRWVKVTNALYTNSIIMCLILVDNSQPPQSVSSLLLLLLFVLYIITE